MHEGLLKDIAVVLSVAAFVSVIARQLKLPSILAYLAAGLIIGPYIPIPLFADLERVKNLSELGVILVMFNIGLEFRISRFLQVLPTAGVTALFEISMMGLVGLTLGYLFGWPTEKAVFLAGALAISSTMIVSKIFEEQKPTREVKEHVFGILVIQDLIAILLITILGTFAVTKQIEISDIIPTTLKLISVLIFSISVGIFFIPKLIRYVSSQKNPEVLTIVAMGVCFGAALLIENLGYSIALGAFLSGVLVSESGEAYKVEKGILPIKDLFAAIFFVSVGMSVDPVVAYKVLPYSLIVTAAVVLFQLNTIFIGGVLSGVGATKSLHSGLALGQIGEFAFIISSIGIAGGILGEDFQAIVVSVAVLSSLTTPLLWKRADSVVNKIMEFMPSQLRILIGLYEAWFSRLSNRIEEKQRSFFGVPNKLLFPLILDSFLLILLPPAILKFLPEIIKAFAPSEYIEFQGAFVLIILALVVSPVLYGFAKGTSRLVMYLSDGIFLNKEKEMRETDAVQKLFSITIWSIVILLVGVPVLLVIRPFTNSFVVLSALGSMFVLITVWLWKRTSDVSKDFESGGMALVKVFKRQTFNTSSRKENKNNQFKALGLDDIESVPVNNQNFLGKSLSQINLRNITGVTVVSILRDNKQILFPSHEESLKEGDVLQVWGDEVSKTKCKSILS